MQSGRFFTQSHHATADAERQQSTNPASIRGLRHLERVLTKPCFETLFDWHPLDWGDLHGLGHRGWGYNSRFIF